MPLCSRCGRQIEPAAGYCPACDDDRRFRYDQTESDLDALPPFEFGRLDARYGAGPAPAAAAPAGLYAERGAVGAARGRWQRTDFGAPAAISHGRRRAADDLRGGHRIALMASIAMLVIAGAVAVLVLRSHGPGGHPSASSRTHQSGKKPSPPHTSSTGATAAGLVAVDAAAAGAPHEAAVVTLLNRYFTAINSHAYGPYERLFSPAMRSGLSAGAFTAGFGTTRDSAARLHSITDVGAGELAALVSFTSHQQAAGSPTQSSCTTWRVTLYMVRHGGRYLLVAPPAGYRASDSNCA